MIKDRFLDKFFSLKMPLAPNFAAPMIPRFD
jgi:hypothetical protein